MFASQAKPSSWAVVGLERFGSLVWLELLDHLQCSFIWVAVGLGFSAVVLCIRGPSVRGNPTLLCGAGATEGTVSKVGTDELRSLSMT